MKAPIIWLVSFIAAVLLYALSSGPALLFAQTPTWAKLHLDSVYWPLRKAVCTPAYRVLLPYWDLFHDREMNPLIPG